MSAPCSKKNEDLYRVRVVPLAPGLGWCLGDAGRGSSFICSFIHSLPPFCTLAWRVYVLSPCPPGSPVCQWELCLAAWLLFALPASQGHHAGWILSPDLCAWPLPSPWGEMISTSSVLSLQARMDPRVMRELLRCGGVLGRVTCLCSPLIAPPPPAPRKAR